METYTTSYKQVDVEEKAYFIAIEGIEGVGKTTLAQQVAQYFHKHGREATCSREPGGTAVAEEIRSLLKDPSQDIDSVTELLLMFASRSHHVSTVIRPALDSGITVISDRYVDASYAYQGAGRGIDDAIIDKLADIVCADTMPDYTILITCDPNVAMQRVIDRQEGIDRIEQEKMAFFESAQNKYLALSKKRPNYIIIDGEEPLEVVKSALDKKLKELIPL